DLEAPPDFAGRAAGGGANTPGEVGLIGEAGSQSDLGQRELGRRQEREGQAQLALDAGGARGKPEVPSIEPARVFAGEPGARGRLGDAVGEMLGEAAERTRRRPRR